MLTVVHTYIHTCRSSDTDNEYVSSSDAAAIYYNPSPLKNNREKIKREKKKSKYK